MHRPCIPVSYSDEKRLGSLQMCLVMRVIVIVVDRLMSIVCEMNLTVSRTSIVLIYLDLLASIELYHGK